MEEKLLREILATAKENNELLRKLNTQRKLNYFYFCLKWGLVALIAYSAYMAATPYIESAQETINNINDFNNQAKQMQQNFNQKSFSDFLKQEIQKRITQ